MIEGEVRAGTTNTSNKKTVKMIQPLVILILLTYTFTFS